MSDKEKRKGSDPGALIKRLERRFAALEAERASWLADCRDIAELILPIHGRFLSETPAEGDRRGRRIINGTATLAHRTMAAGLMAGITSPARPWFRLSTLDETMMESNSVRGWLDAVERRMRHVMAQSNLYTSLHQVYAEEGAFGTAAMLVVEDPKTVIRAETLTAGEYLIATGPGGQPSALMRDFKMTTAQMVEEFGLDAVSEVVRSAWERGDTERWFDVRAAIEVNDQHDPERRDGTGKAWRSIYWQKGTRSGRLLRQSGYEEQPFMTPRWDVLLGASYGTGPGLLALGDVRALQVLERSKGKAIAKMIDPPLIAPSSIRAFGANLVPGGITYIDGPTDAMRPAYAVNLPINYLGVEIQHTEGRIRQAFYADLFLMLSQHEGQMTAREVQERHEEKLLALGPMLNRQHPELLDPLIERVYGIMLRGGLLPPQPEELVGQFLKIQYISVLAQAQESVDLSGIERIVGFTGNLAAASPDILDKVDIDRMVDEYARRLSIPATILRPQEEVEEIRKERAQQQQAASMGGMAGGLPEGMLPPGMPAGGGGDVQAARLLAETQTGAGQDALMAMLNGM